MPDDMTPERLAEIEADYDGNQRIVALCAALRAAWRERDSAIESRDLVAKCVGDAQREGEERRDRAIVAERDRDEWKARAEKAEKRAEAMEEAIAAEQLAKRELVRVTRDRDEAIKEADEWQDKLCKEREEAQRIINTARKEHDEAVAAAAVLRVALERFHHHPSSSRPGEDCECAGRGCCVAADALASGAGKPLLEAVKEAAILLERFREDDLSAGDADGCVLRLRTLGLLPEGR